MNPTRRAFLGVGSLAFAGCAAGFAGRGGTAPRANVRDEIARLDRTLVLLESATLDVAFEPSPPGLARVAFRSLVLAASFADLDDRSRAHPGVQRRLWNAMPEIDAASRAAAEWLALHADEGSAASRETAVAAIDELAARVQLAPKPRLRLRRVAETVVARWRDGHGTDVTDRFVRAVAKASREMLAHARARGRPPVLGVGAMALGFDARVSGGLATLTATDALTSVDPGALAGLAAVMVGLHREGAP